MRVCDNGKVQLLGPPPVKPLRFLLSILILGFAARASHAARPFVTDDARIVGGGGCQVETFVKRQGKFSEREFWFLPACNPSGNLELTIGGYNVHSALPGDSSAVILQGKTLLKPLETNGAGFALTLGALRPRPVQSASMLNPFINSLGSFSFLDDRLVLHANLGAFDDRQANVTRGTWGIGGEILLLAPRLYGIVESYGQRGEKPTFHTGFRFWIVPGRVQVDATAGRQNSGPPERHFHSIGLRILF